MLLLLLLHCEIYVHVSGRCRCVVPQWRVVMCLCRGVQSDADRISRDRLNKLEAILSGDTTIALHLQFLIRTNKADLQILKNTKVLLPTVSFTFQREND